MNMSDIWGATDKPLMSFHDRASAKAGLRMFTHNLCQEIKGGYNSVREHGMAYLACTDDEWYLLQSWEFQSFTDERLHELHERAKPHLP